MFFFLLHWHLSGVAHYRLCSNYISLHVFFLFSKIQNKNNSSLLNALHFVTGSMARMHLQTLQFTVQFNIRMQCGPCHATNSKYVQTLICTSFARPDGSFFFIATIGCVLLLLHRQNISKKRRRVNKLKSQPETRK